MFIIYVAIWRFTTAFDESILKTSVKNRWASAKLFWPRWRNALESKWHINEFSSKTQGNNTFKKEWTPFFIFPVTDVSFWHLFFAVWRRRWFTDKWNDNLDHSAIVLSAYKSNSLHCVFINLNADTFFPELFLFMKSAISFSEHFWIVSSKYIKPMC